MTAPENQPGLVEEAALEEKLMRAHRGEDGAALAELYFEAGQLSEKAGRSEEAGYRYTQAYVFALESGATNLAETLRAKLVAAGREE